jgi:hypothetical protein
MVFGRSIGRGVILFRVHSLRQKLYDVHARSSVGLYLTKAGDIHPADQSSERKDLVLRLEVEIPKGCGSAPQHPLKRWLSQLNGMTSDQQQIGLVRLCQVLDRPPTPVAGVAQPPHHIYQATMMAKRSSRSGNRGFGLVGPSGAEHHHSHADSIAAPCSLPS